MNNENENPEIIAKIEEKTNVRINEILAEKEKEVAKINDDAEKKIETVRNRIITEARNKADAEFSKEKAKHELDLKLRLTKFREQIINDFVKEAKNEIASSTKKPDYEKNLSKMIQKSASVINEPELVVSCNKKDKKIINSSFLAEISRKLEKENNLNIKFRLADNHIDTIGGVILRTPNETIRVDNTYESRIERSLNEIKREIGKMLISQD